MPPSPTRESLLPSSLKKDSAYSTDSPVSSTASTPSHNHCQKLTKKSVRFSGVQPYTEEEDRRPRSTLQGFNRQNSSLGLGSWLISSSDVEELKNSLKEDWIHLKDIVSELVGSTSHEPTDSRRSSGSSSSTSGSSGSIFSGFPSLW